MSSVELEQFRLMVERNDYRGIADELARLEAERGVVDITALGDDPESAVVDNPELELEYATDFAPTCSVYGYYRYRDGKPSAIVVHPSLSAGRDNFTIVHEYGHHVQRHHADWADVRYSLPAARGDKVEEKVADAFAAAVLIPEDAVPDDAGLSARALASVYAQVRASRSAVASRMVELTSTGRAGTVVVCDFEGRVIFARATDDEVFAPTRGVIQPDLARLFDQAANADGSLTAPLQVGLRAMSGWTQTNLTAELVIDHTGGYAFVVITPTPVFGRQQEWARRWHECPNPACGEVFVVDETVEIHDVCGDPRCPECGWCSCERVETFCKKCFMALSVAEQSGEVEHECV